MEHRGTLQTGWGQLKGDGPGHVDPRLDVFMVGDDAVNGTCNDCCLGVVRLVQNGEDVVAVVEVEVGMKWSGAQWRVVENRLGIFGGGGVGA